MEAFVQDKQVYLKVLSKELKKVWITPKHIGHFLFLTTFLVVSDKLSKGLSIHRLDSQSTKEKEERYKMMVEQFLRFDIENGDIPKFLREVIFTEE
jgi:hypothetical protein